MYCVFLVLQHSLNGLEEAKKGGDKRKQLKQLQARVWMDQELKGEVSELVAAEYL